MHQLGQCDIIIFVMYSIKWTTNNFFYMYIKGVRFYMYIKGVLIRLVNYSEVTKN